MIYIIGSGIIKKLTGGSGALLLGDKI
jgi:hypothetical protein